MQQQGMQQGTEGVAMNNNSATNVATSQQASSALSSPQYKYVKFWEGSMCGKRRGQPVPITRLEGYTNATASETLAANWPPTMQIARLISQDDMNDKQYVGKADFLVFRAMNQHGFLQQMQEKKLCAVIQLPSQTLLLSVSNNACRLIGMLFPGNMVFKPQNPSQQQMPQQMHNQQQMLQQRQIQQQQQQMQQQFLYQAQQLQQMAQQIQQQQIPQRIQQQQQLQLLQQQQRHLQLLQQRLQQQLEQLQVQQQQQQ